MGVIAVLLVGVTPLAPFVVSVLFVPRKGRPDRDIYMDALLFGLGGVLPLFVFLLSCTPLLPDSKSMCSRDWVDCFLVGKVALTPLVLWAVAAFRVAQVLRPEGRLRAWIPTGLLVGAIVSTVCFVHAYRGHLYDSDLRFMLVVPLYTAGWYWMLSVKTFISSRPKLFWYLLALLTSVPFYLLSVFWSRRYYQSLPETNDCFVVTAAMSGHASVVGPLQAVERGGRRRKANRQLLTLWRFEAEWRRQAPRSHARFRVVYNRIGPWVAGRIRTPLAADMVYLLIKPVEWVARTAISLAAR